MNSLLGIGLTLLCLQGFSDLDEALAAKRAGRSIRGKVTLEIAKDAVDQLEQATGRDLRALAAIAREGKADRDLAATLITLVLDEDAKDPRTAVDLLASLPPAVVDPAAKKSRQLGQRLGEVITLKKGALSKPLARLYVRYEAPKAIAQQLESWAAASPVPAGFKVLLRALQYTAAPRKLLVEVVAVPVPAAVEGEFIKGLSLLLFAHDEALADAVGILDRPEARQRARLLGAIGYEPHDHDETHGPGHAKEHARLRKRIVTHLTKAVREETGELQARALTSVQRLGLHALIPDVLKATNAQDSATQAAAITALPVLVKACFHAERLKRKPDMPRVEAIRETVRGTVEQALQSTQGEAQIAALLAARALRLRPALKAILPTIAGNQQAPVANRIAALRCFGGVMPRDAKTVDLLIELMAHPNRELASGAWRALKSVARTRLPFRLRLWKSWRARQKLR